MSKQAGVIIVVTDNDKGGVDFTSNPNKETLLKKARSGQLTVAESYAVCMMNEAMRRSKGFDKVYEQKRIESETGLIFPE